MNKYKSVIVGMLKRKIFGFLPVKVVAGALAGLVVGLLYYRFIGCSGGSCPITSNPLITSSVFAIFGILFTLSD